MSNNDERDYAEEAANRRVLEEDDLSTEQAMPVPNDSPSVQGMVREDLVLREQLGVERYGTALQPDNGRDALRDLYEELLDAACYARQAMAERPREDVDAAVTEVERRFEVQLQRQKDLVAELRRQIRGFVRWREIAHGQIQRATALADHVTSIAGPTSPAAQFANSLREALRVADPAGLAVQEGIDTRG